MRARRRVLDNRNRLQLPNEVVDALGLKAGSKVAVIPIGKGVYVAPIGRVAKRRRDGRPTTKELHDHAMRALVARP